MNSWFDPETGLFRLDELVAERETFKTIMDDGLVSDTELHAQSERVVGLLRHAEAELDEAARGLVQELLAELAVLYAVSQYHTLQQTVDGRNE